MSKTLFDPDHKPDGYYTGKREEMLPFIPDEVHRVLDVGCGTGEFGKMLKSRRNDVEIWGVEIDDAAAEEAREKLDTVLTGDIETDDLSLPSHYFDCIVFNDVLEHLRYPWIVLCTLRHNLKANGHVVASIPNVRHYETIKGLLLRKEWTYRDAGVLDKTHLRFFTMKSIANLFERCGYCVVRLEGINGKFPWKFALLNALLLGALTDMQFLEFACVASSRAL